MNTFSKKPIKNSITVAAIVLLALTACLRAQSPDEQTAKLKQQVEQLKQENQQLRQALAETPNGTTRTTNVTAQTQAAASSVAAPQNQELTHWLTLSSNKRHNSRCRYFHNSRGRPCRADEGVPCKICGG